MSKRKQTSIGIGSRRGNRNRKNLPFLPMHIMFNILSRLPAEFLHNDVKYVSKAWADIIRDPFFITMHLLHSSNDVTLLIEDSDITLGIRYLGAKEGKIKVVRPTYYIPGRIPFASHQGLSLLRPYKDNLYIANCVTKQGLMLPSHRFATCKSPVQRFAAGFSRVPQSGALKVMFSCGVFDELHHWHVLTVGTHLPWRKIDSKFTKDEFRTTSVFPISINGIIYWPRRHIRDIKFPAIDLNEESIHWIQVPDEIRSPGRYFSDDEPLTYGLLKLGNYLSCIAPGSNHMEMNVWILEDMLSSTWVKIRTFKCNVGLKVAEVWCGKYFYTPFAWLDNGSVLVFATAKGRNKPYLFAAYNVRTGKLRYIRNVSEFCTIFVVEHTNSLVSL